MKKYKRRDVGKAIVMALRDLGGSASRKQIRRTIAENEYDGLTYEGVYYTKKAKTGMYSPFLFDFNFGLKNLYSVGYVEELKRNQDVVLTDLGRSADLTNYPSKEQQRIIAAYWDKKNALRAERNKAKKLANDQKEEAVDSNDEQDSADNDWKTQLLDQIKKFKPEKFESFSRLLISKMGVAIDKEKGVQISGDHGIDGFGYFRSDEFRTSRVAIQCKRYTSGPVGEAEIRDFKGTMDSFNAEYGIFVTTSYYTDTAKRIAMKGNRTVTLIDGQELTDLIEKYQLHIKPVTTYALDDYYFEKDQKLNFYVNCNNSFPDNSDLKNSLLEVNLYKQRNNLAKLALVVLEENRTRETINFDNAQVEHIMPQRLNNDWRLEVKNADKINDQLGGTIGNLTLTMYNQEMSNKIFSDKKEYYSKSNVSLTREIPERYDQWNKDTILDRTKDLSNELCQIFAKPDIKSEEAEDIAGEHTINEEVDVTGKKPVRITLNDRDYSIDSWRSALVIFLNYVWAIDSRNFEKIRQDDSLDMKLFSHFNRPAVLANNIRVETNHSATTIIAIISKIADLCDISDQVKYTIKQ